MPNYTDNVGLRLITRPDEDNENFNTQTMLNDNWDKIDDAIGDLPGTLEEMGLSQFGSVAEGLGLIGRGTAPFFMHTWEKLEGGFYRADSSDTSTFTTDGTEIEYKLNQTSSSTATQFKCGIYAKYVESYKENGVIKYRLINAKRFYVSNRGFSETPSGFVVMLGTTSTSDVYPSSEGITNLSTIKYKTGSSGSGSSGYFFRATTLTQLKVENFLRVGFVYSLERNAYPDDGIASDGFKYLYQGRLADGDVKKTLVGTYIGTGTGKAVVSFPVGFRPLFIYVQTVGSSTPNMILAVRGQSKSQRSWFYSTDVSSTITWNDNSVEISDMNTANYEYYYMAIG